jgi:hypothetical protein
LIQIEMDRFRQAVDDRAQGLPRPIGPASRSAGCCSHDDVRHCQPAHARLGRWNLPFGRRRPADRSARRLGCRPVRKDLELPGRARWVRGVLAGTITIGITRMYGPVC